MKAKCDRCGVEVVQTSAICRECLTDDLEKEAEQERPLYGLQMKVKAMEPWYVRGPASVLALLVIASAYALMAIFFVLMEAATDFWEMLGGDAKK